MQASPERQRTVRALRVCAAVAIVCVLLYASHHRLIFSQQALDQVRLGMSEDQVVRLLGRPNRISYGVGSGQCQWDWLQGSFPLPQSFTIGWYHGQVTWVDVE